MTTMPTPFIRMLQKNCHLASALCIPIAQLVFLSFLAVSYYQLVHGPPLEDAVGAELCNSRGGIWALFNTPLPLIA